MTIGSRAAVGRKVYMAQSGHADRARSSSARSTPSSTTRTGTGSARSRRSCRTGRTGAYVAYLGYSFAFGAHHARDRGRACSAARGELRRGALEMAAAIEIRSVSKQFRLYHEHYTSLKERVIHFGRIPYEAVHGARSDIDFDVEAGLDGRHPRAQRLGQVDAAEVRRRHPAADDGRDRHPRPAGRAARARRRLPPGAHRPREHLHERVDPRARRRRDIDEGVRRDRRVRRAREVHRHAGAALLVGHVHAARVRGRGERRSRHPARRRGALGRRRGVPAQVPRTGQAVPARGPHDPVRHPRRRPRAPDLRPGDRARPRRDGRRRRARRGGATFRETLHASGSPSPQSRRWTPRPKQPRRAIRRRIARRTMAASATHRVEDHERRRSSIPGRSSGARGCCPTRR